MKFMVFWKKYGEPITAISILICLIISISLLVNDHKLKKEINKNCGWGEEDYKCFCEKSESMRIKNLLDGKDLEVSVDYATLDE